MFLPKNGTVNYADDNIPYSTGTRIGNITFDLEQASNILSKWFQNNRPIWTNTMCFSVKHLKLN